MASTNVLSQPEAAQTETEDAVASFLELDREALVNVSGTVTAQIAAKIREFQQLQAENLKCSVTIDELRSSSSHKLGACKDQIHSLLQEIEAVRAENLQLEQRRAQCDAERQRSINDSDTLRARNEALEQQKQVLEANKNDVAKLLNEKIGDISTLQQETERLLQEARTLRQQNLELEGQARVYKSEELKHKADFHQLSQKVSLLNTNNEWLESQLNQKNSEFNAYRQRTQSELASVSQRLETCEGDLQAATKTIKTLREQNGQKESELEGQFQAVKKLTDELTSAKQEFTREMSLKQRLVELLEGQVSALKSELEFKNSPQASTDAATTESQSQIEDELVHKTQQLEESELKVQKLEQTVEQLLSADEKTISGSHSLPDLYADIGILKKQVIHERRQKEFLQNQVEAFVVELENKVPMLSSFKDRNDVLEKELAETAYMLDSISKDKDETAADLKRTKSQIRDLESQISALTQQRSDLARQVQYLLIQVTVRGDSHGPLSAEETAFVKKVVNMENTQPDGDAQGIISERLVEFKNIVELQAKNADLLHTVRNLANQLETEERKVKSKTEAIENDTITEAKEAIVTLQDHIQELETRIDVITRERDAYKAIQSQTSHEGSNGGLRDVNAKASENSDLKIRELEELLSAAKREAEANVKLLMTENQELARSKSELVVNVEKEKSSRLLAEERLKISKSSLLLTKQENEELNKRGLVLENNLANQDTRTQETISELIDCKSQLATLSAELKNSIAKENLLNTSHQKLKETNEQLTKERNELTILVTQLQTLQKERDTLLKDSDDNFKGKIDSLEAEISQLRTLLSQKATELSDFMSTSDSRSRWYQEKIDALNESLKSTTSDLNSKTQMIQELQSQQSLLTSKLRDAETKSQSYSVLNQTDDVLTQTDALRSELEKTRINLKDAFSQVDEYKGLYASTKETLTAMTTALEHSKQDHTIEVETLKKERDALSNDAAVLKDQLANLNSELDYQKNLLETLKHEHNKCEEEVKSNKTALASMKDQYQLELSKLTEDLNQQAMYANKAQENYEQELQRHADVSKTISQLREEAQKHKNKVHSLEASITELKKSLEENESCWAAQKQEYETQASLSSQRIEDLSTQNRLLFDQISLKDTDSIPINDELKSEARELISTLKRECDILQTKLELAKRDESNLKQKLEFTEQELSVAKSEIRKSQVTSDTRSIMIEENSKILEQLNQVNLLRESNITLRNELQRKSQRNQDLERNVEELQEALKPLENDILTLQRSVGAKDKQISLMTEEVNRWKQRSQDILLKYERVDPEEHKKLAEELSQARAEAAANAQQRSELEDRFQRLKKQARERLDNARTTQNTLNAELTEARESQKALEDALDKEREKTRSLKESIKATEENEIENSSATRDQLQDALQKLEDAQARINEMSTAPSQEEQTLREELERTRQHVKQLEEHLAKTQNEVRALEEAKNQVSGTEAEIARVKTELIDHSNKLLAEKEAEIKEKYEKQRLEDKAELEKSLASSESLKSSDIENLKKEWEEEYEQRTIKRIEEANEILRKRIRLPTEEKINKIIENRKRELDEEFEAKLQQRTSELAGEKPLPATFTEVMKRHKQEVEKLKADMKREMDEEVAQAKKKAFDEGKQQASMKSMFLEKKIAKLEAQAKAAAEKPDDTTVNSPDRKQLDKPSPIAEISHQEDKTHIAEELAEGPRPITTSPIPPSSSGELIDNSSVEPSNDANDSVSTKRPSEVSLEESPDSKKHKSDDEQS